MSPSQAIAGPVTQPDVGLGRYIRQRLRLAMGPRNHDGVPDLYDWQGPNRGLVQPNLVQLFNSRTGTPWGGGAFHNRRVAGTADYTRVRWLIPSAWGEPLIGKDWTFAVAFKMHSLAASVQEVAYFQPANNAARWAKVTSGSVVRWTVPDTINLTAPASLLDRWCFSMCIYHEVPFGAFSLKTRVFAACPSLGWLASSGQAAGATFNGTNAIGAHMGEEVTVAKAWGSEFTIGAYLVCEGAWTPGMFQRWTTDPYCWARPSELIIPGPTGALSADIQSQPAVSAAVSSQMAVAADVQSAPRVSAGIGADTALSADIQSIPAVTADVQSNPRN